MSRMPDRWITVPKWHDFQHYHTREAPWIKTYAALLHKPEYVDLSLADRGLLHAIWLAYHATDGRLRMRDVTREARCSPEDSLNIHRRLHRLSHAGFIGFSASKPLPLSLNTEKHARASEAEPSTNGRETSRPCPLCEVGGGLHTADCPTLQLPLEPS